VPERPGWTFLTSHGFVLLAVSRAPDATVRQIADAVGVTERQAHRVLADLAQEGYIVRRRVGRRNHYRVDPSVPMRHPGFSSHSVGDLLAALADR
jgi:predicted DNA-binding transcriptional regulator YafY